MSGSLAQTIFRLGYEISPILLTNGIASGIPGQTLPIVALTESTNFVSGLLNGKLDFNLDNYFSHFKPMPGATLVNQQIGMYPFANQTTAANAVISQPLQVSMLMICPAQVSNGGGGYGFSKKLSTLEALKKTLETHNLSGGTYTVVTPSYIYTNCVMTLMKDVSDGSTKQPQWQWQLDFLQPLVAQSDALGMLSSLMNKISGGLPISSPSWSGLSSTVGSSVSSGSSSIAGSVSSAGSLASAGIGSTIATVTKGL